jgi:DNA-binding YbaB/EbfC family protein
MLNPQQLKEQIRRVQEEVQRAQEDIAAMTVIGYAAGTSIQIEIGGDQQARAVHISPLVVDPDDIERLEELILLALNDALTKIQDATAERMNEVTGGMDLPDLM